MITSDDMAWNGRINDVGVLVIFGHICGRAGRTSRGPLPGPDLFVGEELCVPYDDVTT